MNKKQAIILITQEIKFTMRRVQNQKSRESPRRWELVANEWNADKNPNTGYTMWQQSGLRQAQRGVRATVGCAAVIAVPGPSLFESKPGLSLVIIFNLAIGSCLPPTGILHFELRKHGIRSGQSKCFRSITVVHTMKAYYFLMPARALICSIHLRSSRCEGIWISGMAPRW